MGKRMSDKELLESVIEYARVRGWRVKRTYAPWGLIVRKRCGRGVKVLYLYREGRTYGVAGHWDYGKRRRDKLLKENKYKSMAEAVRDIKARMRGCRGKNKIAKIFGI